MNLLPKNGIKFMLILIFSAVLLLALAVAFNAFQLRNLSQRMTTLEKQQSGSNPISKYDIDEIKNAVGDLPKSDYLEDNFKDIKSDIGSICDKVNAVYCNLP